jgi:hypothetical protein
MAIDFPNSPAENDNYTVDGKTWTFSDGKWALNVGAAGVQGPTGPTGPAGATGPAGTWATTQEINGQTGTSYTLVSGDLGKMVMLNNSSPVTVTVGTSLNLSAGQSIDLLSMGTGQVTVSPDGATLDGTPGLKLRTRYSSATLFCVGEDSYVLIGDLSA